MIKIETDSQKIATLIFETADGSMNVINEKFLNEFPSRIKWVSSVRPSGRFSERY